MPMIDAKPLGLDNPGTMLRRSLAGVLLAGVLLAAALAAGGPASSEPAGFDAAKAMEDIANQLAFGSRAMGEPGHARIEAYIRRELEAAGFAVEREAWVDHTSPDHPLALTNLIARQDPSNPRRVVLATHYDSIIRAYADKDNPQAPMPGANNSASGVALLLETARALHRMAEPRSFALDLIFFDGEEGRLSLGAGDPDWAALGSPYFIERLAAHYPAGPPLMMIDFDMVCFARSVFRPERLSLGAAGKAGLEFFEMGRKAFPEHFSALPLSYAISDDQSAFAARGIPSFLVIGFEYEPFFNTTKDTLDKCSAGTLEAVGTTLLTYLRQATSLKH
jgi:glutaminyl-peptide cyclotransferase